MNNTISIDVPILTRVEGEGALQLHIRDQTIESLQLKIYEPPRLFEKFLVGRDYNDVIDIVARICGICPVAYQMSATHAIEQCFGIVVSPWVRAMRRLFYCGEWIESHSMHIHFLAAPDFLGFTSAPDMAKVYPNEVRRGVRLQALGNDIIRLLGGRSVHPVGACVGGFYRAPEKSQCEKLLEKLKNSLVDCAALLDFVTSLSLPDNTHDFTCVSLHHPNEYPMNEGQIVSSGGLAINIEQFDAHFTEFQVPYSNALHCLLHDKTYLAGPLARMNLNYAKLPGIILTALKEKNLHFPSYNMYHSIIARAIEIYYCVWHAIELLENYRLPDASFTQFEPRAGIGFGCTEAPRGMLWQHYTLDEKGFVRECRIVPPTSQNQARIEEDLHISLKQFGLDQPNEKIRHTAEMLIRNYDPCISCSTHFLKLHVLRA